MIEQNKAEIYKELLDENEKLITYASRLFYRRNYDKSLSICDFKQDARMLLWDCFDLVGENKKVEIHKLWKCCLFRHVNNLIKKQYSKKRKGFHIEFDGREDIHRVDELGDHVDNFIFQSDLDRVSVKNVELEKMFMNSYLSYMSEKFLNHIEHKYNKRNLKYKILKLIITPTNEFKEFVKQNSKKDTYIFRMTHVAKYFNVSRPAVTIAIKLLKEDFQEWKKQTKNSPLMKELNASY